MTIPTYTYTTELDGLGVEVTLAYSVAWGEPESGTHGPVELYDPGSNDTVEELTLTHIDGKPCAHDDAIIASIGDDLDEAMINHARSIEDSRYDPDYHAECRADARSDR